MGTPVTNTSEVKETAEQRKAKEEAQKAAIAAALESGDIVQEVTERDADGNVVNRVSVVIREKGLERHYTKLVAKTLDGALALAGGEMDRVLKLFTDALDLKARATIRQQMLAEAEGPEKNYLAAAKALAKLPMYKNRADLKVLDDDARIEAIAKELADADAESQTETDAPTDTPTEEATA